MNLLRSESWGKTTPDLGGIKKPAQPSCSRSAASTLAAFLSRPQAEYQIGACMYYSVNDDPCQRRTRFEKKLIASGLSSASN
jgi:hypothetical protein